jgi:hypothetical protein
MSTNKIIKNDNAPAMESVEIGAQFRYRTWDRPVNFRKINEFIFSRVLYFTEHTESVLPLTELRRLKFGLLPMQLLLNACSASAGI